MVIFAIESRNYLSIPFLTLFVGGYYWAGCMTLWNEYQHRLVWERELEVAEQVEKVGA